MAKKHLIIGCGPAALSASEKIRNVTTDDDIQLVTMEDYPPYSPSVLPYLLAGRTNETDIWLRDKDYFNKMNISFAKGREVVRLLPDNKEVVYKDGTRDTYDTLLIATGAKPIMPQVKGLDEAGFLAFHTMQDYRRLLKSLGNKKNIAIYGAGLVAVEVAMALLERGCPVKLIVRSRVLRRYLDKDVGSIVENILGEHGAKIYAGSEISEVKAGKDDLELVLSNGESIATDTLITAVGVEPNTGFLDGSTIKVNRGILVDHMMRTNIADIYAAGDVAEAPGFFDSASEVNPILPNALEQGKIAGANMAGESANYQGSIGMNILKLFGNTVLSIGLSIPSKNGYQVLEEKDLEKRKFSRFVYKDNRLVGAMILNIDVDPGAIRYLIENRIDIGASKEALLENPGEISRWLMLENESKGK